MSDQYSILMYVEAEAFAETLQDYSIPSIGSERWNEQHERLEKMNIQAAVNAALQNDEYIKDCLISANKVGVIIHELLAVEVWKEKVFPQFAEINFQPKVTFPVYMALYHEATVVNLLETIMFHRETAESAGDTVFDLVDYCHRKLTYLVCLDKEQPVIGEVTAADCSNLEELTRQKERMEFDIAIKSISLVNYIADHLSVLPLSVMTRILNTLDFPILLVELVQNAPWLRRENREISKFVDGKWKKLSYEDSLKLTKIEGQVWLALYQLLMKEECMKKYDLNPNRKNSIIRLRSHLTEVLLDQLPVMVELQRYLEHLAMMEPPAALNSLILEQVPEIRDNLLRCGEGKWRSIAKKQAKANFDVSADTVRQQAKRLADTYNMDRLEGLLTEAPKCAICGHEASKRCSKCRNEWYCRRECQVEHWPKHKKVCNLMVEAMKTELGEKS